MSNTKEKQGIRDVFTNASPYNQLEFIIEQKIRQMVNTSALVRIDSCTSQGSSGPAGEVSATPLVAQTDADGNALPMVSIPRIPHGRLQGGIAAIVIDPVPGDIGVASFCKADSSTVTVGTKEPQRPGSYRSYDQADGMLVANVSNKAPEVWIELKQDRTILIHAPEGCRIETDKRVEIFAPEGCTVETNKVCEIKAAQKVLLDTPIVEITGNLAATGARGSAAVTINGTVRSTGDQIAGSISQINHVHTNVTGGSGTSGKPI